MEKDIQKEAFCKRTKTFAAAMIRLFTQLDCRSEEARILGRQMLRSGTSVGANYREASRSRSEAEFVSKIKRCAQEADELIRIFVTVAKNTKLHKTTQ